jgi:hypothetical protein
MPKSSLPDSCLKSIAGIMISTSKKCSDFFRRHFTSLKQQLCTTAHERLHAHSRDVWGDWGELNNDTNASCRIQYIRTSLPWLLAASLSAMPFSIIAPSCRLIKLHPAVKNYIYLHETVHLHDFDEFYDFWMYSKSQLIQQQIQRHFSW